MSHSWISQRWQCSASSFHSISGTRACVRAAKHSQPFLSAVDKQCRIVKHVRNRPWLIHSSQYNTVQYAGRLSHSWGHMNNRASNTFGSQVMASVSVHYFSYFQCQESAKNHVSSKCQQAVLSLFYSDCFLYNSMTFFIFSEFTKTHYKHKPLRSVNLEMLGFARTVTTCKTVQDTSSPVCSLKLYSP